MPTPRTIAELQAVEDEDLPVVVFELLVQGMRSANPERRGAIGLEEAFRHWGSVTFSEMPGPLRGRLVDAFQALCERGIVWFNRYSYGYTKGEYEFTKRGRTATVEDVRSPWPSSGAVALERFPEHADWGDETMGAYFRMAVATHHARVPEAALFLIGGAAERLLGLVEKQVAHLLGPGWERRRGAADRLAALVALFSGEGYGETAELLALVGGAARWARNDVGHPRPMPPDVTPAMVAARICEFPGYVARVLKAAEALASR